MLHLGLRPFPIVNVKGGDIPPIDSPLLIELRVVADQEPAILSIVGQDALLSAEWCASPKRCRAHCADSLEILRVDDTIPIILLLYIVQTEAGVLHHCLIDILDGSFGIQYVNVCRNGVDDQAQIAFVR